MSVYQVTDPTTGKKLRLHGDRPPTERELDAIFSRFQPQEVIKPPESNLSRLAKSKGPLESSAIAAGKGMYDIGRGLGLVDKPSAIAKEAYGKLEKARPISTTIGEVAGQSAPFLGPGVGLSALAGTGARVLGTAALGATEGGIITRGQGGTTGQQLQGAGIGGTVAGALELVLPRIIRFGGKFIRRALGRDPVEAVVDSAGNPSAEFIEALDKSGLAFEDIVEGEVRALAGQPLDPAQAGRKAFLKGQGLNPTQAEMTREAADFQAQQEVAKTSGAVRTAIEGNEGIIGGRFDDAVTKTGDQAGALSVTDFVTGKATALDQVVSQLYKAARIAAPGEKNVRLESLHRALKKSAGKDTATNGAVRAVASDLQSRGVLSGREMNIRGRIDVETAEEVRKLMNQLYDPQQPFRNIVLKDLKDALDDDVLRSAGQDIFSRGRKAKHIFEQELSRAKISKFDARKQNLVRDMLENKIDPDQFTQKVVFGKGWRAADLKQLKDYTSTSDAGKAAWDSLRSDALQSIKDGAFIGPEDALGNKAITRAALERTINKIGWPKLSVLFNPQEIKFLHDMVKVSKLREPVRGTAIGKGPSAQAVSALMEGINKSPLLKAVFNLVTLDIAGRKAIAARPRRIQPKLTKVPSQVSASLGVAGAVQAQEE